jgi:3-isopropylmalate dehydrogenase
MSEESHRLTRAVPGWPDRPASPTGHVVGVLPGEGIGPEIMEAASRVLRAVTEGTGVDFDLRTGGSIGLTAEKESGQALTAEVAGFCESVFADGGALLCGPGGGRFVYELRAKFDLFCKLTPIHPSPTLHDIGPVDRRYRTDVDMIIVRENRSGLYFGEWGIRTDDRGRRTAFHHSEYDEKDVRRILDVGIRLAQERRRRLCVVGKPGGVPAISKLWGTLLRELTAGTDLEVEVMDVGNATYQLVACADRFDVVVAPNLLGDILSDAATLLLGSRGMAYSGNFSGAGSAAYQTGHGAAWDLAGTGRANPAGQVLSVAMMLRESFGLEKAAAAVEAAIRRTLDSGARTTDIAAVGSASIGTHEMGKRVADAVAEELSRALSEA